MEAINQSVRARVKYHHRCDVIFDIMKNSEKFSKTVANFIVQDFFLFTLAAGRLV